MLPANLPFKETNNATAADPWQHLTDNASRFAAEWAHEVDEKGEAHSFWDEFLQIFNIRRRQFARHEARAKRSDNRRGKFDWASISPEIFGSLFQEVLTATERRSLGAHYTSEKNILRLIEPLFLDELREEFKAVRKNEKKLAAFRGKLHKLRFLDPACGCGNFLVVTYRELRLLDLEVVRAIRLRTGQLVTNTDMLKNVWLTQFHGLEIKPVSALIAQTALWLTEHQCNRLLEQHFGIAVPTIPLDETPDIRTGN